MVQKIGLISKIQVSFSIFSGMTLLAIYSPAAQTTDRYPPKNSSSPNKPQKAPSQGPFYMQSAIANQFFSSCTFSTVISPLATLTVTVTVL